MTEHTLPAARIQYEYGTKKEKILLLIIFNFPNVTYTLRRFSQRLRRLREIRGSKAFHAPNFLR